MLIKKFLVVTSPALIAAVISGISLGGVHGTLIGIISAFILLLVIISIAITVSGLWKRVIYIFGYGK